VDKYDTLEYSRVKAITVSVRLRNFLCALINTNRGESSWFATTICEDPRAKVFGGGEVGVDAKCDGEGSPAKLFGEGPPEKGVLAEAMLVKSLKMVAKPVMPKAMPM
jgi:hypothetical protein